MVARLTVARFVAAIEGSGGIKMVICRRVPCDSATLNKWLTKHPTMAEAFEHECNRTLDMAHSVVVGNIETARKQQERGEGDKFVDSTDAKWYLSRKGKREGFGQDPSVVVSQQSTMTLAEWRKTAAERLAQVEELGDDEAD